MSIEIRNGNYTHVEVIDILKSVRSNVTPIGHPVVVYAIHHWQAANKMEKINEDKSIRGDYMDWEISDKYFERAKARFC